ncbi:MAG: pantetheine-phosphate adenylyltransferase, partial [Gammaproteobacteria bacterium]
MIKAIYPGSFDPITNGHIDVIKRASRIFDQVTIAVSQKINKKSYLSEKEKIEAINLSLEGLKNVEVIAFDSLLVDFAKKINAQIILRGLRAVSDFEFEFQLAGMNKHLDKNIETFFLTPSEEFSNISSS